MMRSQPPIKQLKWRATAAAFLYAVLLATFWDVQTPAHARDGNRPYDTQLLRLSEIIGGIHYLRALCGHEDGQAWRRHMEDLIDAEGSTALRRAVLARRFNLGYRNYSRTYKRCTVTAKSALTRFIADAERAAAELLATRSGSAGNN